MAKNENIDNTKCWGKCGKKPRMFKVIKNSKVSATFLLFISLLFHLNISSKKKLETVGSSSWIFDMFYILTWMEVT